MLINVLISPEQSFSVLYYSVFFAEKTSKITCYQFDLEKMKISQSLQHELLHRIVYFCTDSRLDELFHQEQFCASPNFTKLWKSTCNITFYLQIQSSEVLENVAYGYSGQRVSCEFSETQIQRR